MEESRFDDLLARVSRETTRRGALSTLLGGALLLTDATSTDASNRVRCQRRRNRRQRRSASSGPLKPSWVWVVNRGPNPVTVAHGESTSAYHPRCCRYINTSVTIPPWGRLPFAATTNGYLNRPSLAFVVINDRNWFVFQNPVGERPDVSAALNGPPDDIYGNSLVCCADLGTTVVRYRGLSEGQETFISMQSEVFRIVRYADTNWKVFELVLPETL